MSATPAMSATSRRAVIGAAFVLGFALMFTSTSFRAIAVPWYEPLARRWLVATRAGSAASPAMDWYGRLVVASAGAAVTAAVVAVGVRLLGREPAAGSFGPMALAINTAVLFWACAAAYAWTLAHRPISPPPPMSFEAAPGHAEPERIRRWGE